MSRDEDRVPLLCVAVQLHRLLLAVRRELPQSVPPMDQDLVHRREPGDGAATWERVMVLESATMTAVKRLCGWAAFSSEFGVSFDKLQQAYACSAPLGGLVRSAKGPAVKGDTYKVRITPVGLAGDQAKPCSEAELRAAAHGLLHGLAALHGAGIVHRDVRWANVARDEAGKYFLIDLETCAHDGDAPARRLLCWDSRTLEQRQQRAVYTCASDVYLLGRLLRDAHVLPRSAGAERFLEGLLQRNADARPTAIDALADPWIACAGPTCMEAGALR